MSTARAQTPPTRAVPASPADQEIAAELFRRGVALLEAGDHERALDYFLRSRAAYPSSVSTANAAICLDRLGRYDEALEMYEDLLVKFAGRLDAEDQAAIGPAMAALRRKVGSVRVSANVEGSVVIDGRLRGKLPLASAVRVLAGKHLVRVIKDGYAPFEKAIEVSAGDYVDVDARLVALAAAGALRVEAQDDPGSDVFVDGVLVGASPWEGTLGPGNHLVWTRSGDRGSAPAGAVVLQGQTALLRTRSSALGPDVRIEVSPATAKISLNGVVVGTGSWSGRLPVGRYAVVASEEGYSRQATTLVVPDQDEEATSAPLSLVLPVDPEHPRWPKAPPGQVRLVVFGGAALGSTLHSDGEDRCRLGCSRPFPAVWGYLAGVRVSYAFSFGLGLDISAGYQAIHARFSRRESAAWHSRKPASEEMGAEHTVVYALNHDVQMRGFFLGAGLSCRTWLAPQLGVASRLRGGVLVASVADPVQASASQVPMAIAGSGAAMTVPMPFVTPEIAVETRWGPLVAGLTLGVMFFPSSGPGLARREIGNPDLRAGCTEDRARSGAAACAPNSTERRIIANRRAFGPFVLWTPQLVLRYEL